MDSILLLALVTFGLIIAFLVWNRISTARHQKTNGNAAGMGGSSDPMAGATDQIRPPDELRASLNAAAGRPQDVPR